MYNSNCHVSYTLKIEAQSGQKINFTLINLNNNDGEGLSCGVIVDNNAEHQLNFRLNSPWTGLSHTHSVSLIMDENCRNKPFVIGYQGNVRNL